MRLPVGMRSASTLVEQHGAGSYGLEHAALKVHVTTKRNRSDGNALGKLTVGPAGQMPTQVCGSCDHAVECFLARFDKPERESIQEFQQTAWYPKGVVLFFEGEPPRGIHVVCSGEIKTFAHSRQGGGVILRRVGAGQVLGLSSSLTGSGYPVSAETLTPSQIIFLSRAQFLRLLQEHPNSFRPMAEALAVQLQRAWEHTRMLALNRHVVARLADLLLARASDQGQEYAPGVVIIFPVTQEDIAESIGTTRETVSRILSDWRRQGILRRRGNGFVLLKPKDLQALRESHT